MKRPPPAVDSARLLEAGDQFRNAFLYSSIGMALVGLEGEWLKVNPSLCDLLGYRESELLGGRFQDVTHPDDLELDLAHVRRLLAGEIRHYRMEKRYRRKDGQMVWTMLSVSLAHRPDGTPLHFISQVQDISEMKRAEEAVRNAEHRFRAIFDNTFQLIGLLSPDGTMLEANEPALRFSGFSAADIVGRPFWEVPWWTDGPDTVSQLRDAVARAAGGEFVRYEAVVRGRDGIHRTMDFSLKPVRDAAGDVVLLIPEGRDISDRVALEAQLRQAQKMEAIGRLAGGIAHDFNNLLSVIITEASLLRGGTPLDATQREGVDEIFQSAQRGAALTRQLLAFGRRQLLQPRFVDINGLVSGVVQLLRRVLGEDVTLTVVLGAERGRVRIDPGQLEQALLNLAINARDALPHGGAITIETADVARGAGGEPDAPADLRYPYASVSVRDDGTGIAPDVLPHIFEPFYTTKDSGKGTGLGLAMVYGFVTQSTGYIEVASEAGEGTTFTLLFPSRGVGDGDVSAVEPPESAPPRGSEIILLVEDEAPVRRTTRRLLEYHGYTVLEAPSAEAALDVWRDDGARVDMLLTDCIMPGMHGPALAARLKELRPDLRVALISGYTGGQGDHCFELPPNMLFIQKPFLAGTFLRLIRNELDAPARP